MSASSNVIVLTAALGRDPELKFTQDGLAILKFSLPINVRVRGDQGWKNETVWWGIAEFGKSAEQHAEILRKGSIVTVSGKMAVPRTGEDGRVWLDMVANSVDPIAEFGRKQEPKAEAKQGELPF